MNAPETCADCGSPYWPERFDVTPPYLCDDCVDARERWATEQEARRYARRLLKMILPVFVRSDVA